MIAQTYILYNPMAGTHSDKVAFLEELQNQFGSSQTVYLSMQSIKSYRNFFQGMYEEDTIIICGGDGTLNRFVNETDGISIPQKILYYATGTGNDFLRDINVDQPTQPIQINNYLNNLPTVSASGKTMRFLNGVGYGIDGYCCEVGDKLKRAGAKSINYTKIAIQGLLLHYKPTKATVTVDGHVFHYERVWLAPTMHGRYYGGGMMPTPEQNRIDPEGKLSVLIMHNAGKLKALCVFPSIFKGTHIRHKNIAAVHTGRNITVEFDRPVSLQVDGETILNVPSYTASSN